MPETYTYKYPMVSLSVDCVVFSVDSAAQSELRVLLMQRKSEPFANHWALPGAYVQMDENLEKAALRALRQKTGLSNVYLEQLYTFAEPRRDPRGRVVSCAYYALARPHQPKVEEGSRSLRAEWFSLQQLPALAFDHDLILTKGLERLRGKLSYEPVGLELLPKEFTLPELRAVYEAILGRTLDRGNFRKAILRAGLLHECRVRQSRSGAGRPPILYRFDKRTYTKLKKSGFTLDLSL